jgi:steroid delta-isomerase-like uncharacterized protein
MRGTPLAGIMHGVEAAEKRESARRRESSVTSEEEKNKELARRFVEAFANGYLETLEDLMTPDFVDRSLLPGQGSSREEYKRSAAEFHTAFSNTGFNIEDQIAQGDKVMTKFSLMSVHRGEFLGVPPSGEVGTYSSIRIHCIVGGRIAEEWSEGNLLGVLLPSFEREIRSRERVEQDLRVARSIQQASLPKEVPTLEGWQVATYYRSAREVGGDFYDFHPLSEGKVGLAVGDATGKGVSAALVMSTTCGMLRAVSQASDSSSPGEMLERVNKALLPSIPANMFVTCFYAILDPKSGILMFANAGHDLPYVRRGGDCEELRARGMPLGLMPGMEYEEKEIMLDAGEAALFYSDGLVEAHDLQGEMFGFPRLRDLIAEHDDKRALGDFLLEELYSFVGEGWEQEDDITLLTLRRSASLS